LYAFFGTETRQVIAHTNPMASTARAFNLRVISELDVFDAMNGFAAWCELLLLRCLC
jgi:hypothetical protein